MKINLLLAVVTIFCSANIFAQPEAAWMRQPNISPDGSTILFGYKGDLYKVDAQGGLAYPITLHEAHDKNPVWSPDGQFIAFSSNRHGNFDVFVMSANGGDPIRLTYYGADDIPYSFSPDGKQVIFSSARMAPAKSVRFFMPFVFSNLYQVPTNGGREILVTAAGADFAHINKSNTKLVFQDAKGYEDNFRKHHTSSVTRDIWIMDLGQKTYRQLSSFIGEDREPVFSPDENSVYFLSERSGSLNVCNLPVNGGSERQISHFREHPVRDLSISSTGVLCYTHLGSIYTQVPGSEPKKLSIRIQNDGRGNYIKNVPIRGNVREFALSPNGKEIAFMNRGEVFVSAVESGQTRRITNTPQQERMLAWNHDGTELYYSAERDSSWDIYRAKITRKQEPYFYMATLITEEPVIATSKDEFEPKISPDGKEVAFLEERNRLLVYNLATKKSRTIIPEGNNYSYADGDQYFRWSQDGKWLLADDQQGNWAFSNTALYNATGKEKPIYPIRSGSGEYDSRYGMDGKVITWLSTRNGRRGPSFFSESELDIYAVFLDQDAYDRFNLSKDEYDLLVEMEKKDSTKSKKDSIAKANWTPDFNNLDYRKVRLTANSLDISDYALTNDGSKLYYLAKGKDGYDLWLTELRKQETKLLAPLGGTSSMIEMAKDEKAVYVVNKGGLVKIDEGGKITPVPISGEMQLDLAGERTYIFNHFWRQVQKKFYDPALHGVDWNKLRQVYASYLPHINNNFDFADMMSEMLGELNASHTGGGFNFNAENPDVSASLGIIADQEFTALGVKVDEILIGGPLHKASLKIKAGDIIEKIDGETIAVNMDYYHLLNRKVGLPVLISVYRPSTQTRWDEIVKPINSRDEYDLMYKRWVKQMEEMTDKLSGGRIGYLHVSSMDGESYRELLDRTMGRNLGKEALVVDTRFNGGGWLHDDLNTFLSGKQYLTLYPRSQKVKASEPLARWSKPSAVIMSESNYSDAYLFPYTYKQLGIGKLIGMPVPGTGTAVWWEPQIDHRLYFGIPMIGTMGKEGRFTENMQLEPDIKVPLRYEEFLNGKDAQLEAAVKHLLEVVKKP